jgi:beta-glucosidase
VESEGYDRSDLSLPGRQDDLVRAVLAANPRTIVLVNSGSPVLLPWREDAAAIVLNYFAGQEYGSAVADILTGTREPGGRLPTTWPARLEDVPVLNVSPDQGVITYDEDIHVGYRAWLRAGVEPAYPFGYGLSYTTWDLTNATTTGFTDGTATVTITARNTGTRPGKHVIQVYASRPNSTIDRPQRWLVGFTTLRAQPGEEIVAKIQVHQRDLAHWNKGWHLEPGPYTLHVGPNVQDTPKTLTIHL